MWTDDKQRCCELDNLPNSETRAFNRRTRLAIRTAAVTHSPPERFHDGLDSAEQCSRWRGNMLNKDELAAGFEHPHHFQKCATLVSDATQNQGADHAINRRRELYGSSQLPGGDGER